MALMFIARTSKDIEILFQNPKYPDFLSNDGKVTVSEDAITCNNMPKTLQFCCNNEQGVQECLFDNSC
jgi:hypothetical protein